MSQFERWISALRRLREREPAKPWPSDDLWPLIANAAADAHEDDSVKAMRELDIVRLNFADFLRGTPPPPVAAQAVPAERQWCVCVAQAGRLPDGREFHPLLLEALAAFQLTTPCAVYLGHASHWRLPSECLGYLDMPTFEAGTGRLLARLNTCGPVLQRRLVALQQTDTVRHVKLSMTLRAYYRAGTETMVLAHQLGSVDVVPTGGCPGAMVLGPWSERDALLEETAFAPGPR